MRRRNFLAAAGATVLAGCNRVAESDPGGRLLDAAEGWHQRAQRLLNPRTALAPEYPRHLVSPVFRGNGSVDPKNGDYPAQVAAGFVNWRLEVRGLVETPLSLTLDVPSRLTFLLYNG